MYFSIHGLDVFLTNRYPIIVCMTLSCAYHVDPILNQSDIDNFINPLQDQYIIKLTGDGFKIINGEILFYFGQNILNSHLRYLWQSVLHVP